MYRVNGDRILAEPYKIKMVEPIIFPSDTRRKQAIKEAGYNTFLLQSEDVYIDLLTDSGTNAMSENQWAGLMLGDESYAGSKNFRHLWDAIEKTLGYKYIVPTHQGRGAEHLLFSTLTKKGSIVPRNMYFTTSKQHVEIPGGKMIDVIVDEAHDPYSDFEFKGNIDIKKLEEAIQEHTPEKIAFVSIEADCNMAGGQPVSMENMRKVKEVCDEYKLKFHIDATRSSENAFFIKEREKGFEDKSIPEILREMMGYTDFCCYSSKKDCLVNIGGFIALNDKEVFEECKRKVVVYEGLHTYGGMAGRDMEALARGLVEGTDATYLSFRINQVKYLWSLLEKEKVPIVRPNGGHAVYLDAIKFLPHISREEFPAEALTALLYEDSAVRTMERGAVSKGRDAEGNNIYPKLELVRMTIPRRVYTNSHMEFAADSVIRCFEKKDQAKGLKMVYEPKDLRFFQAKFEQVE